MFAAQSVARPTWSSRRPTWSSSMPSSLPAQNDSVEQFEGAFYRTFDGTHKEQRVHDAGRGCMAHVLRHTWGMVCGMWCMRVWRMAYDGLSGQHVLSIRAHSKATLHCRASCCVYPTAAGRSRSRCAQPSNAAGHPPRPPRPLAPKTVPLRKRQA